MSDQTAYYLDEFYTSAIATPELVGREDELSRVQEAIYDINQSFLIYVKGQGGIGKTALVGQVLEDLSDNPDVVAGTIIDLYHTPHRTPEGFSEAVRNTLYRTRGDFKNYDLERRKLDEYNVRPPDDINDIAKQRRKVFAALIDDYNKITLQKRIVLALDTAEYLYYEQDPVQDVLGISEERSPLSEWLLGTFLPAINNSVVILAGRPGPESFLPSLQKVEKKSVRVIDLSGLREEAALEYFDKIIYRAQNEQDKRPKYGQVADVIQKLTTDQKQAIFWGLCELDVSYKQYRVRPILLSLAISYIIVAGQPLDIFVKSLSELKKLSEEERRSNEERLGADLIKIIREYYEFADRVLIALAYARKGANAELIARIADFRGVTSNAWDVKKVQRVLDELRNVTFIKTRRGDDRLFLHDEMYDFLRKHVLDRPGQVAELERIHSAVVEYYKEQIEKIYDDIDMLYAGVSEEDLPDPKAATTLLTKLQDALVENLHYELRFNLYDGFLVYHKYADEAIDAHDDEIDIQLRSELLNVIAQERAFASKCDDQERIQEIDTLMIESVIPDAAIRWVKRYVYEQKINDAWKLIEDLRTTKKDLITPGHQLALAGLTNWEGLALSFAGDMKAAAIRINDKFIEHILDLGDRVQKEKKPLWSTIAAWAYNHHGYLNRVRGNYIEAAKAYQHALQFWRFLGMPSAHATSLNNLAYALGLQGDFESARRAAKDSLSLRQRLGKPHLMVLSKCTSAEIDIFAGHYEDARRYADSALTISQRMKFRRGEGLAHLSLAAICRFMAEPDQVDNLSRRKQLLEESLQHSRDAHVIFTKYVLESEREIKSLIEEGTTLREISRFPILDSKERDTAQKQAVVHLKSAMNKAKRQKMWYLYLDAALSCAWLYYYSKADEDLRALTKVIEGNVDRHLREYKITTSNYPIITASTSLGIFSQLARLQALYGISALNLYEISIKELKSEYLETAAQHFTMAFEYDALISRDFREIRRVTNVLYSRLKKFNHNELYHIYYAVTRTPGMVVPKDKEFDKLLFWEMLENNFGSYEVLQQLAD